MQWIEVSVPTRSDEIDDVCAQLAELGAGGMVVEDETDFQQFLEQNHQYWDYVDDALEAQFRGVSRIKFYLADDDDGRAQLEAIRAGIGRELTTATVRDSDWENNWRQYYQPIEVGERLVVVPEWLDAPADGRLPLRLDPGLIFGTGSHATTRMCLAALEHCAAAGRTVLDLGCGSGILGIGALLLGCAHVTGCDIDPKAPEVAAANAALNGFTRTGSPSARATFSPTRACAAGSAQGTTSCWRTSWPMSSSRWPRWPRRFSPRAARSCARASSTGARTRWQPRSRVRASPSRRTTRSRSGTASRLRWRDGVQCITVDAGRSGFGKPSPQGEGFARGNAKISSEAGLAPSGSPAAQFHSTAASFLPKHRTNPRWFYPSGVRRLAAQARSIRTEAGLAPSGSPCGSIT